MAMQEYINSAWTVFLAIFISMATSVALPLLCYTDPNGDESMISDPIILCWQPSEHHVMLIIAALSLVTSVVPVLALIAIGTLMHGTFLAQSTTGRSAGVDAFRRDRVQRAST